MLVGSERWLLLMVCIIKSVHGLVCSIWSDMPVKGLKSIVDVNPEAVVRNLIATITNLFW